MVVQNNRRKIFLYSAAVICTFLIGISYWFGLFDTLQNQLTDRFFIVQPSSDDIIIIDIDEESLNAIGRWPWDRSTHATLLENVGSARAIGFDVLFTEPSRVNPADDVALAQAISNFEGNVILAAVIDEQSSRISYPIEILLTDAEVGFVNTSPDRDGIVREVVLKRTDLESFDTILAGNQSSLDSVRFYYHGPAKTYTTISYFDVYSGGIPKQVFAGKTILVGASAAGLGDVFQTPFGAMPGVEIHANTIESLRDNKVFTELPTLAGILLLILIAGAVLLVLQRITSMIRIIFAFIASVLFIIILSYVMFTFGIIIPHLYALILFTLVTGISILMQYLFETKEKQFIRNSFEHYVAPEVIKELYSDPSKLGLGGETRNLSILFSDIRGFTTISEQLTPQQLMSQLNEYLEEMSEAIMNNNGLVDKYIGDAVMAFWGAPLTNKKHATQACESVLAMTKALEALNAKWSSEGKPPFAIGIGVSTGDVVVGNMGSKRRFNYSIIGDEVNFSARIEGLTKQYGVQCLIGETTYQAIKDATHLPTRELDDVLVKGKVEPRRIYELITSVVTEKFEKVLEQFALGRVAYLAGDFKTAITHFDSALKLDSNDGPSQVFLDRSKELLANPPSDWTGVFEFKTK